MLCIVNRHKATEVLNSVAFDEREAVVADLGMQRLKFLTSLWLPLHGS